MPPRPFTAPFVLFEQPWGRALRCLALPPGARHLFSSRDIDVRADGGATPPAWEQVATSMGVAADRLLRAHQVHGRDVLVARTSGGRWPAPADACADVLVSDDPDVAITVRVADCVPLLIADARTGVVAAVHAGWRGTAAGAAQAGVAALVREFGSRPADLHAALGPSIGPRAYEVGEEVRSEFVRMGHGEAALARWFVAGANARPHLDVWRANVDQLREAGVAAGQIASAGACTASNLDWFFSHRAEGPGAGRMVAAIRAWRPTRGS